MPSVNILSVITAFILGFLFHGPLPGKIWMKLADIHPTKDEKLSDMIPQLLWNLLSNLATAYVLAVIYLFASSSNYLGGTEIWRGVFCALWLLLGFLVTSSSIEEI